MMIILLFILTLILAKVIWVIYETSRQGSLVKEQTEIVRRANYLISKVATSPKQLMDAMPRQIPPQFQGEWAIYSCSMTCKALANIAALYPQNVYKEQIARIISIAMSVEIRGYDAERWDEDPFIGLDGNVSHLSYYSHLAWMIGEYKLLYNDNQFDTLYHSLCRAMYRRISDSPILNIPDLVLLELVLLLVPLPCVMILDFANNCSEQLKLQVVPFHITESLIISLPMSFL